jgi:hypothetical protein
MANDRHDLDDSKARRQLMITVYEAAKKRRLVRRGMKLWKEAELRQTLARLDQQPDRIH